MKHTDESIRELIKKANKAGWTNSELNVLVIEADVSEVRDMSGLFKGMKQFNLDISNWNVSSVTNMQFMFSWGIKNFNQDISKWDVSSVRDMKYMFHDAESFNQDIGSWNVSSVTDMQYMFRSAKNFNQDISAWDMSSVVNMYWMFKSAESFNQDISTWDISNITNMSGILSNTKSFNQDLTIWQALSDSLDSTVLTYCKNLTSDYINSYLSKKELELKEELTKTGRLGLKKSVDKVTEYKLLSNFRTLKELVLRKTLKNRLRAKQALEIDKEKNNINH
jgi:surface protein